jgi:hypothetical protein
MGEGSRAGGIPTLSLFSGAGGLDIGDLGSVAAHHLLFGSAINAAPIRSPIDIP